MIERRRTVRHIATGGVWSVANADGRIGGHAVDLSVQGVGMVCLRPSLSFAPGTAVVVRCVDREWPGTVRHRLVQAGGRVRLGIAFSSLLPGEIWQAISEQCSVAVHGTSLRVSGCASGGSLLVAHRLWRQGGCRMLDLSRCTSFHSGLAGLALVVQGEGGEVACHPSLHRGMGNAGVCRCCSLSRGCRT